MQRLSIFGYLHFPRASLKMRAVLVLLLAIRTLPEAYSPNFNNNILHPPQSSKLILASRSPRSPSLHGADGGESDGDEPFQQVQALLSVPPDNNIAGLKLPESSIVYLKRFRLLYLAMADKVRESR